MDLTKIHDDLHHGALQLIAEHRAQLLVRARALCGNDGDAEELVIRTIDQAIRKIDTYSGEGSVLAWMTSILTNLRRNDMRSPVVRGTAPVESGKLEEIAGADWSTDEEVLRNSDSEAIREAVAGLDPKYHQVLLMRYYDELTAREIAAILNKPLGTVLRRMQIAHRLLAAKLGVKLGRAKKPLAVLAVVLGCAFAWGMRGVLGGFFGVADEPPAVVAAPTNEVSSKRETNDMNRLTKSAVTLMMASSLAVAADDTRRIADVRLSESDGAHVLAVSFDGKGANDDCLIFAYGPEDGGDDLAAWQNVERVGFVGASDSSATVPVPKSWPDAVRAMRVFLIKAWKKSPFDCRFDSVETDGRAYVNTRLVLQQGDVFFLKMRFANNAGCHPLSAYAGSSASDNKRSTPVQYTTEGWTIGYNGHWSSDSTKLAKTMKMKGVSGADCFLEASFTSGLQRLRVGTSPADLALAGETYVEEDPANTTVPLYLFARNCDQNANGKDGVCPQGMRVYSLAVTNGVTERLNLVPCEKDGVVGFWDTVSESFLASEVEGSLTGIGPTPTEYEYGAPYSASRTLVPRRVELTDIVETDGGPCAQLAFSGDGFGTESVFLAWGERDFGDAVVAWPNWRDAGILSADRSEGSYPLSLTEKPKGGFVKAFLMTDVAEVDGTRVEYIESTDGQQYLDTGHLLALGDAYRMKMRTGPAAATVGWHILSAYGGSSTAENKRSTPFQYGKDGASGLWILGYNARWTTDGSSSSRLRGKNLTLYWLTAVFERGSQRHYVGEGFDDPTYGGELKLEEDPANTTATLYAFARNCDQNASKVDGVCPAGTRVYSIVVERDGKKVKNFLPCVKDGRAGLYESVHKTWHPNIGSGDFTAGGIVPNGTEQTGSGVLPFGYCRRTLDAVSVVSDAEGRETAVRVTLSAEDASVSNFLCVAFGAADGGTSPAGWEKPVMSGFVKGDVCTVDVPLPDGWGERYGVLRAFLVVPDGTDGVETTYAVSAACCGAKPAVSSLDIVSAAQEDLLVRMDVMTQSGKAADIFVSWPGAEALRVAAGVSGAVQVTVPLEFLPVAAKLTLSFTAVCDGKTSVPQTVDVSVPTPVGSVLEPTLAHSKQRGLSLFSGRLATVGDGTTRFWIRWGHEETALNRWTELPVTVEPGAETAAFAGVIRLPGPSDLFCRCVSSNVVTRAGETYAFGSETETIEVEQVGSAGLMLIIR